MKPPTRYGLSFLAGIAVGVIGTGMILGRHWIGTFWSLRVGALAEDANVAREIYTGHAKELADRLRDTFPRRVAEIEKQYPAAINKSWTYWMIKDAYEAGNAPIPSTLAPILTSLPPRESCEKAAAKAKRSPV